MATDINEGLYDKYVSRFKKEHNSIDLSQMEKWSRVNLKRLKGWLPEDRKIKILDAGCGHGNVLHLLKMAEYVNVTGVDFSKEQIEIAKQINSNVYDEDIFNFLDKSKEKYDLIFAYDLIEHIKKDRVINLFKAFYDNLSEKGIVIAQLPNSSAPRGMHFQASDLTHEQFYSPDSIAQLGQYVNFTRFSFREVKSENIGYSVGPFPINPKKIFKSLSWKLVKGFYKFTDYAEGHNQKIYTRNMLVLIEK